MSTTVKHKPGTLVHYRQRDWMVLPSDDPDLLRIKPLGGSEEEETAIFLPITIPHEKITSANFPEPNPEQIGSFETARLLYDAFRLSFRNASGPFRCMGKLSFRPRAYQLIPLVMSLKMDTTRLLIADDVGIGKTIEALIILKELMERGEVKRFAVICPPHLCEQWQQELRDKLDIQAEIIRSSTAAKLDRQLPDDQSVFHHVPYQVVSIDYVKADKRRGIFLNDCPEFIIVDEAHTCTLPAGAKSKSQQQRFALLHDLSANKERQIVLLTATPHSGKDSEFASLLGLLKPEFSKLNFETIEAVDRKKLARHFVQRKRENIKRWLNESTEFPERDSKELGFILTNEYLLFYNRLLHFAKGISTAGKAMNEHTRLLRSWAAISLIKGSMSSPAMAMEMLTRRKEKIEEDGLLGVEDNLENTLFEELDQVSDVPRQDLIENLNFANNELKELDDLHKEAQSIFNSKTDQKIETTIKLVKEWVKEGFAPIIFCHYIPTANYVAERLKEVLPNNIHIEAITSELADEQRKERIELMGKSEKRILVATDCLSEGINLQDQFTAVLHYDLPWNPNRIEQREGRVDRFGQAAPIVKTYVLYGENNDMDMFILEVLIRKVRDIQRSTGVSISIGENSKSIMTEAAQRLLFNNKKDAVQQELFKDTDETISNELELARKKGENIRSIFAHETIDPATIKADLEAVDEAIGDIKTVKHFVCSAVQQLGGSCEPDRKVGFILRPQNLPAHISRCFNNVATVKLSFDSPTPKGYIYIGRNHKFTELLCQFLIALSFEPRTEYGKIARVCEVQTDTVFTKTVLVVFRVRNVIKEVSSKKESIAEEMYLWGYSSVDGKTKILDFKEAKTLLLESRSLSNLSAERQQADIKNEMSRFDEMKQQFLELAGNRADELVTAHSRFKDLIGGRRYEKATPVLPPDVMGVYILMPQPKNL
ncbi:helicase-related protein [Terrimonas pollutisoli]|uniref:helicase-related protein n=1 Tax=Terrimonas pollutisoli TaxID=3034147 RepID=UPI0023ECBD34|nr:helicase-related protein [Terrimonas sp. H1YJ31]